MVSLFLAFLNIWGGSVVVAWIFLEVFFMVTSLNEMPSVFCNTHDIDLVLFVVSGNIFINPSKDSESHPNTITDIVNLLDRLDIFRSLKTKPVWWSLCVKKKSFKRFTPLDSIRSMVGCFFCKVGMCCLMFLMIVVLASLYLQSHTTVFIIRYNTHNHQKKGERNNNNNNNNKQERSNFLLIPTIRRSIVVSITHGIKNLLEIQG